MQAYAAPGLYLVGLKNSVVASEVAVVLIGCLWPRASGCRLRAAAESRCASGPFTMQVVFPVCKRSSQSLSP